ncbi:hypothetical protein ACQ86N_37565 [Puia sp. P3]|uniref:hypothetical protein n=1 Tax=Puia sp. P3 TaxID=3423952 RepID=UPI003D67C0F2
MRPSLPDELARDNKELPQEGMMFVGDRGKILAGFNVQNPQVISGQKMEAPMAGSNPKGDQVQQTLGGAAEVRGSLQVRQTIPG